MPHPNLSDLPALLVLGLHGRGRAEWSRLRALQYARLAQIAPMQALTQAIAGMAGLWLFRPVVAPELMACWMIVLAGSVLWCGRTAHSFHNVVRRSPGRRRMLHHLLATLANALVWAAPMLGFAHSSVPQARIEMWTLLAMLTSVSAVVIPAVPLASVLFAAVAGVAAAGTFVWAQDYVMALVAGVFTAITIGGAIEASRNYLLSRLAQAGVAESNELVSMLLREYEEGDANWLWETDAQQHVLAPSQRFVDALGLSAKEVSRTPLLHLFAGGALAAKCHPSLREFADKLMRQESFSGLTLRVSIRGEERWWEVSGCPRYDSENNFVGFRGVGSDVTEAREHSDRIAWLARYDTLTGLPNRMALTEALRDAMVQARLRQGSCAFLMIDLDRFKVVNDTLGHLVGDQLLALVSERLTALVDKGDTCARLGGDEFAIVIADASDPQMVEHIAISTIMSISEPYDVDGHRLSVGASIGSAMCPKDGESIEALMRHADLALYRAKDEGGGVHCHYTPGMSARAAERRRLETALRGALARNEISLHFQPIMASNDGALLAYGAMARWQSPEDGLIGPDRFIPIAEETRMSAPIGEWVLRTACEEAMQWPLDVSLAVNVSSEQLLDSGFIDSVVWALAGSGLAPQRLSIEVTETIFARDAITARAVLEGVLALGCRVSLDDFGSGQTALCHLRALHFSTIKIERSFLRAASTGNREALAIIRAAVAVASSLEMEVVAVGVENEAELELARKLDCGAVQGFLLGAPITGEQVLATLPQLYGKAAGSAA